MVNDGSTDGSVEIAREWISRAENSAVNKVTLTILPLTHQGLSAALDSGIRHTSCSFVARIDADDVCEPYRLERQLHYLQHHRSITVVGGQAVLFSGSTEPTAAAVVPNTSYLAHNMPTHPLLVQWEMVFRCALIHPTVMLRREAVLECGGYQGTSGSGSCKSAFAEYVEDYWLWSRILQRCENSLVYSVVSL